MFVVGFEKVARRSKKEKSKSDRPSAGRIEGRAAAGVLGGGLAGTAVGLGTVAKDRTDHKAWDDIHAHMRKKYGLKTRVQSPLFESGFKARMRSHFNPATNTVVVPHSAGPAVLAHELGHAHHFHRMSPIRKQIHGALRTMGPLAGVGAGLTMARSKDEKKRKWAPAVTALGAAPMLYQEGRATAHALKSMHERLGRKAALRGAGTLLPAFASYALPAAGLAYATRQISKIPVKKEKQKP